MSDGNTTKRDSVAELLTQLKRGHDVKKDEIDRAVNYHSSLVLELQGYKDITELSHKETDVVKANTDLRHQLHDQREENRLLSNKLNHYIEKAKHGEKVNDKTFDNGGNLRQNSDTTESITGQLEKLTLENVSIQRELSCSKGQALHYKSEFEKLQREYKNTVNEYEDCKKVHNNLKDEFKKTKIEYKDVADELEDTKDTLRKLKLEKPIETKKQENRKASAAGGQGTSGTSKEVGEKKDGSLNQERGQSKALEKLKEQNQQIYEENRNLVNQISELRNRLSVIAGHKLTDGNPQIADLSDAFRPTKISEQFRQLYDDEWTQAFEELDANFKREEEKIDLLANIIKDVDYFCTNAGSQQLQHLMIYTKRIIRDPILVYQQDSHAIRVDKRECTPSAPMTKAQDELADKLLKDFRKSLGIISKTPLLMIFRQDFHIMRENLGKISSKALDDFLEKAFTLIWVMKLQDPVMEFAWSKRGDRYDKAMYNHYTKRGDTVTQCIWPAVLLYKDGPLMSKGVVQGN